MQLGEALLKSSPIHGEYRGWAKKAAAPGFIYGMLPLPDGNLNIVRYQHSQEAGASGVEILPPAAVNDEGFEPLHQTNS